MPATPFQRYGLRAISKVVMDFYDRALGSSVIGHYFEGIDMGRLIEHQTQFIVTVMGGPASFSDDELRESHAHLAIDGTAYREMTRLLEETLRDSGIEDPDIQLVMQNIESRAPLIVTR